jgi:SAM-dependent methyltransferase
VSVKDEPYDSAGYGDRIAHVYDDMYPEDFTAESVAAVLASWADDGPVLELGIGTGRLALPLARNGIDVHGVESSRAMLDKLRGKPGGADLPIILGDFSQVDLGGPYRLVFVAFNTFFGLVTQEDQIRCFANVAAALFPHGRFVMEAFVPDLGRFDRGQRTATQEVKPDSVTIESSLHDQATQVVRSAHVVVSTGGTDIYPVTIRYAWPSELDLMARLAGLELENRWSSWQQDPFTSQSGGHISVWRKP